MTDREREILQLLLQGLNDTMIAERLFITFDTGVAGSVTDYLHH